MSDYLTDLRARAEAATPGPWSEPTLVDDSPGDNGWWVRNGKVGAAEYAVGLTVPYSPKAREDAIHIATFNPATVLALLDVAAAAEAWLAGMEPIGDGSELRMTLARVRALTGEDR